MKSTKLTAALLAAATTAAPLSLNSPSLFTPSTVFAEDSAALAKLPEWVPTDFDSATGFRNTYGATHIENGLICIVYPDRVKKGSEKGTFGYRLQPTFQMGQTLKQAIYSHNNTETCFNVFVYQPQKQGNLELQITNPYAVSEENLDEPLTISTYTFSVNKNLSITETDIYSWLPDSKSEYNEYLQKHGEVSVKDNYVVFCTMRVDQLGDKWEADSTNKYENINYLLSSDCTMQVQDLYDDGSVDIIYVYQAKKDGYEKISWVRTSDAGPQSNYTVSADCVILNDAQTVLMNGQTRVIVKDADTGKLVPDEEFAMNPFKFHTDLIYEPELFSSLDGTAANYTVTKNNSVLGESMLCPSLSSLAEAYKKADMFKITTEEQPEIKYYDNGAMDLVFKRKSALSGDVNADGTFSVSDVILLQKWLAAEPDTKLADWKAADFNHDNVLNAVDLSMMKEYLIKQSQMTYVEPDERFEYAVPFYVLKDGLKLYLGPDESYEAVASLPANTRMMEKGAKKNNSTWLFTEYNGQYGWIDTVDADGKMVIYFEEAAKKPVIYLYPEEETDIHIELELTESELNTTYPKYENGWDVTAYPDGTLLNKADGSHHRYLFWDSVNCRTRFDFTKGFCVAGSDTERFLKEKLTYMGLTETEMNEFIVYWLPLMEHNAYDLIAFQGKPYTDSAKLTITPTPDSECRIFMAYVPLETAVDIEPQQLETFNRTGFAVVEWGGVEVRQ